MPASVAVLTGCTVWIAGCLLASAQQQAAQTAAPPGPPALENNGKPITLPFECSEDDIHWAGLACSEDEPCPIYLELSSAASPRDSATGPFFATGNIHSDTVTLYSVLLASEDEGRTWREAAGRVRGAGLDRIQFADNQTGWISGQTLFPISQDPFLLQTTDGGKTWRRLPVFEDNHFGSIQQFYFDSKTAGNLVIDQGPGADSERYVRYESPDGGETWSVREESNKPLQLKSVAPPRNLRVRADAATRSFHIERRQGERWLPVASFAVRLPVCKTQ